MTTPANSPVDVMITGGNFIGKGAEAMMHVVMAQLRQRRPEVRFWAIPGRDDLQKYTAAGINPVHQEKVGRGNPMRRLLNVLERSGLRLPPRERNVTPGDTLRNPFQATTCVLDVSGFAFSDQRGRTAARWRLGQFMKARTAGNDLFFMPQSWGPFEDPKVRRYTRRVLKCASLVYAREQGSYDYLENAIGLPASVLRRAIDIAFLFDSAPFGVDPRRILGRTTLEDSSRPFVTLTPNMRIYERVAGEGEENAYHQLLAKLIRHLLQSTDCDVVLIPHESAAWGRRNDAFLCASLAAGAERPGRVAALPESLSAAEVKEVIGASQFLIAGRYHSLVAALSKRRPVAVIGWSHKYDELMGMLGLEEFVADVVRADGSAAAEDVVKRAFAQKESITARIRAKMPDLEEGLAGIFDEVVSRMGPGRDNRS